MGEINGYFFSPAMLSSHNASRHATPTMPDAVVKRGDEFEAIQKRQKGGAAFSFYKHYGREEKWSHPSNRQDSK